MDCQLFPISDINQKVFQLGEDARLVILVREVESKLEIHIKLVDKISGVHLCLSEDLIVEIIRESRKFWRANIDYPCANLIRRIHVREELGSYLIKYQKKKIILSWEALLEMENRLPEIMKNLRQLEVEHFIMTQP